MENLLEERLAFHVQEDQFKELPAMTAQFDRELAEVGARLQALHELQPTSVRCQALSQKDIPQLRQRLQELQTTAEHDAGALETASADSAEAQHTYQVMFCLCRHVNSQLNCKLISVY